MAKIIEITEGKVEKMSSLVEDMLLAGGELMHCLSKMSDEYYGDRRMGGSYGSRSRYGNEPMMGERYFGMRGTDHYGDYDDYDMMGERRRRMNRMR